MNQASNFSMYHKAMIELIKSVFTGNVVLESVDTAFDNAIKQTKGAMKFPFISVYPTPTITFENDKNSYPGYMIGSKMFTEVPVFDENGRDSNLIGEGIELAVEEDNSSSNNSFNENN